MSEINGLTHIGRKVFDMWKRKYSSKVATLEEEGKLEEAVLTAQGEVTQNLATIKKRLEKEDPLHPHPTMLDRKDYFRMIETKAWEEVLRSAPKP